MAQFEGFTDESDLIRARVEMSAWYQSMTRSELVQSLQSAVLAPGIRDGFDLLRRNQIEVAIASITWSFIVDYFADQFRIVHRIGTHLMETGEIRHFWPRDKGDWVPNLARSLRVPIGKTAGVGDSSGDFEMLEAVRHPVFVGKTVPPSLGPVTHFPEGDILQVAEWIVNCVA